MTKTAIAKLSSKSQMVLPKEVRKVLGIEPGDRVLLMIEDGFIRLFPNPENYAEYTYGLGKDIWEKLGGGERFHLEEKKAWE